MRRAFAGGLALVAVAFVLLQYIAGSDRRAVEKEIRRLLEGARGGGVAAAGELLGALAEDYRGSTLSREEAESLIRRYVEAARIRSLTWGGLSAVSQGEEIIVPMRVDVDIGHGPVTLLLTVVFGERDDAWRVVDVTRWNR